MPVVWVHWLMARGQILKESLGPLQTPYWEAAVAVAAHYLYNSKSTPGGAQRAERLL